MLVLRYIFLNNVSRERYVYQRKWTQKDSPQRNVEAEDAETLASSSSLLKYISGAGFISLRGERNFVLQGRCLRHIPDQFLRKIKEWPFQCRFYIAFLLNCEAGKKVLFWVARPLRPLPPPPLGLVAIGTFFIVLKQPATDFDNKIFSQFLG